MNNKWHKNKCSERECQGCHPPSALWMGFFLGEARGRLQDPVQEAGVLLYHSHGQGAAPSAGQATADGLQFAPLKDIFHVMCGKEQ